MHSRTSQFSLKTIQLQNNNSLSIQLENIRRKKNGSYLDLFGKKTVKTYNMTCVSVREKRRCVICIYIFLMVEMFYSFERCFTLFDLPLYSFTSLGVNRSAPHYSQSHTTLQPVTHHTTASHTHHTTACHTHITLQPVTHTHTTASHTHTTLQPVTHT